MTSSSLNTNNQTKIIHLISSFSRGGRERQLANIVANTDHERYPTKVIYFNRHQNSYIDDYDFTNEIIQFKAVGKRSRIKELHQILKKEKPDIVYTWGNGESASVLLLQPFHKFKLINGSIRHGIRSRRLSHYFRTMILHLSPNIVANSLTGLKVNHLKRGKVLYNGVDEKFIGICDRKCKIKDRIGVFAIDEKTTLLISVANFVPYKDYFSVLKSLKELHDEGFMFYYLILGEGPLRKDIEQRIIKYNLSEHIKILGSVQNVCAYLRIADVFIHSSKGEGCSNAILEAMAAGLPIIASDTGGTHEIMNGRNGYLFEYKNHAKLGILIKKYIASSDLSFKHGMNSLDIIRQRFTIDTMMKNYYEIINNTIDNKKW